MGWRGSDVGGLDKGFRVQDRIQESGEIPRREAGIRMERTAD